MQPAGHSVLAYKEYFSIRRPRSTKAALTGRSSVLRPLFLTNKIMLSLFPQLLYPFYAITVVRVTAALVLLAIAWQVNKHRDRFVAEAFPIVGHPPLWLMRAAASITALIGLFLFVGSWTQLCALLGMLVSLKLLVLSHYYKSVTLFSRTVYVMLFFICFSLVLSGAGAYGFDLPL